MKISSCRFPDIPSSFIDVTIINVTTLFADTYFSETFLKIMSKIKLGLDDDVPGFIDEAPFTPLFYCSETFLKRPSIIITSKLGLDDDLPGFIDVAQLLLA